jgi:hypothetical protein
MKASGGSADGLGTGTGQGAFGGFETGFPVDSGGDFGG